MHQVYLGTRSLILKLCRPTERRHLSALPSSYLSNQCHSIQIAELYNSQRHRKSRRGNCDSWAKLGEKVRRQMAIGSHNNQGFPRPNSTRETFSSSPAPNHSIEACQPSSPPKTRFLCQESTLQYSQIKLIMISPNSY